MPLSPIEFERYGRHLVLPEVGRAGQERLRESRVLIVGAGGLGSPVALYLAAAGVGTIGVVDADTVDRSNLQRQILHGESDVGRPKVDSARDRLAEINPHVTVETHSVFLDENNAIDLVSAYDLVVDGTDNFTTRYLVNDACVLAGVPNVYGSIYRFEGQVSIFGAPDGPCYRCLFPAPPPAGSIPNCAEGGVLGVLPGMIGTIQAAEAVKWLLGLGTSLRGRLLLFAALEMSFREFTIPRDPACAVCGESPTIRSLRAEAVSCATQSQTEDVSMIPEVTCLELAAELASDKPPRLLDVREPVERDLCAIEPSDFIPLGELPDRVEGLDRDANWVVYCKMGGRSAAAVQHLQERGFTSVRNLTGGVRAWAAEVDPKMPVY